MTEVPGGFNPEISRAEVDKYKQIVKSERVLDVNNTNREAGALKILNDMGFKDKDNVFTSLVDKNKNTKVIEDKVGNLGVAIKEVMDENPEMKQAVVAGSYSTDKFLPEVWRRGKPEDPSIADLVVDGFRRDIGKGDLKTEFGMALEGVDYLKNLGEDKSFVADQVEQSKVEINKIKVSPWDKKAMAIKMESLKYLSGLENELTRGKRLRGKNKDDVDDAPYVKNAEGEWEGGSRWEMDPEHAAVGMKYMSGDMRWSDETPPAWFKTLEKEDPEKAYRISLMFMVNSGAAWVSRFGPDLEKIKENPLYKAFDNEKFSVLFNDDFKLVTSKMLHDLCETYTDQNAKTCMRYKEMFYKKTFYKKNTSGDYLHDENDKKIIGDPKKDNGSFEWNYENNRKVKGVWGKDDGAFDIDQDVLKKLVGIRDYKDEMSAFLANKNNDWKIYDKDDEKGHKKGEFMRDKDGKKVPGYMSDMNAFTAWNLFYMMGDSSLADRMRVLPTYGGIINDGIRTLNTEFKALAKLKIAKGETAFDSISGAELYGGQIGAYCHRVMSVEEDLKVPINGKKTLRENVINGDLKIFANKTCYGFFDFVQGSRDLRKQDGRDTEGKPKWKKINGREEETLGTLLWNYGYDKDEKEITDENEREKNNFDFGSKQVDFLNWYRDQQEAAALILNSINGKEDVRDVQKFVSKLETAFGMVDEITINGERTFTYTTRPDMWANIILGSFGVDMTRLSSEHIRLKTQPYKNEKGVMVEPAYNAFVYSFLTHDLGLSDKVNINEVMRCLGVSLNRGENPQGLGVSIRNNKEWAMEKSETNKIIRKRNKNFDYDGVNSIKKSDDQELIKTLREFGNFNSEINNHDAKRIYEDLSMAIRSKEWQIAKKLWIKFVEKNKISE